MHISPPAQCVLNLVFAAGSVAVTRPRLEQRSGLSRAELNRSLGELARLGLVDERRLRLTLPGLALAAALAVQAEPEAKRPTVRALQVTLNAPIPLFSRREAPRAVA